MLAPSWRACSPSTRFDCAAAAVLQLHEQSDWPRPLQLLSELNAMAAVPPTLPVGMSSVSLAHPSWIRVARHRSDLALVVTNRAARAKR
jgi:hypothetical protein